MWTFNIILTAANMPQMVPYFCMRCRSRIHHLNRDILVVWQGDGYPDKEIPKNMGRVQVKCHGCETIYNFYFQ